MILMVDALRCLELLEDLDKEMFDDWAFKICLMSICLQKIFLGIFSVKQKVELKLRDNPMEQQLNFTYQL